MSAEGAQRLDRFVAEALAPWGISRVAVQRAIAAGGVLLNGRTASVSQRLSKGAVVTIAALPHAEGVALEPQAIPLAVVYEDDDLVVINKPRGLVVHPAKGTPSGTLVNALLYRYGALEGQSSGDSADEDTEADVRPGIVHRLDKDTTGLMVIARSERAGRHLRAQILARSVHRGYLAVVRGHPAAQFTIDAPVGRSPDHVRMAVTPRGRPARTHGRLRSFYPGTPPYSLLELDLETGRTHQIRVHLAFAGFPVACDPLYGQPVLDRAAGVTAGGQLLHAYRLSFRHPADDRAMTFEAPPPDDFAAALDVLQRRVSS